ncbi:[protein-PII] uridylyltransferase [Tistrella mobilis]|uniref:[protein-PII] uridylyltransferase n=1 Tax=Tistrella mobilis TaxID=171437 RepID=UPI0035575198
MHMTAIRNKRQIIHRRALMADIEQQVEETGKPVEKLRREILGMLKEHLAKGREEIRKRFDAGADGAHVVRENCYLIDQIVRTLFDLATTHVYPVANPTSADRLCLVAIGGYGRGELAPHSDVDLLFLMPYKQTPRGEQVAEYILYLLWDLGLKVGHAVRSVDECISRARGDMTIRTSLLESRQLCGEMVLYEDLRRRFATDIMVGTAGEFIEAKLNERDERHRRMGDSRYVLEPNVKEGKGGLRDLHTLFWIAKYSYRVHNLSDLVEQKVFTAGEYRRFAKAQNFLWTVRCHLHYLAGRPEDRLTFDVQTEIGRLMGYADRPGVRGVERFMKHYYLVAKDVGDLTRILCAALESANQRQPKIRMPSILMRREIDGFRIEGGRLTLANRHELAEQPIKMLKLFRVAQSREMDVHPQILRWITQNLKYIDDGVREDPSANQVFLDILTSPKDPEATLRHMNEAGVFGRFIPDFGRVVAQTQHDMYHVYTVDEHTIRAIGILSGIEKGNFPDELPLATRIVHEVLSRRVLYMAVLLHDIAKGRGGDHSVLGEEIARKLCPRVGLTPEETETVAWLVRWHLLMSAVAFKRDIEDPKTVHDFADQVQSMERLRLLTVLTVADIRAVGPNVWNGWKGTLLRELYYRAAEQLSGGHVEGLNRAGRIQVVQDKLRERLADWTSAAFQAHVERMPGSYWLAHDAEVLERHARLVAKADRQGPAPLVIDVAPDRFRSVAAITVYAPDHHGLFAGVAGAMALAGGNIVDARIVTTTDGMALDTFWVQDSDRSAYDDEVRVARMRDLVGRTLSGELRPAKALAARRDGPKRTDVFQVTPRVLIDNRASNTQTVIEVTARDRPGLLFAITSVLSDLALTISSAHVATYGERAVDTFYVKDVFGLKITHQGKLTRVREELLAALDAAGPVIADDGTIRSTATAAGDAAE